MKVKCKRCLREWNYKGKSKYYITCPQCYSKINIRQVQVKGGNK